MADFKEKKDKNNNEKAGGYHGWLSSIPENNEWLENESQRQYSDSGEIGPEIKKKNDVGKMLLIAGLIYLLTTI